MVHYNCNQGTTSEYIMELRKYFRVTVPIRQYDSPDSNPNGKCTKYAWTELNNFIVRKENPFERNDLHKYVAGYFMPDNEKTKHLAEKSKKARASRAQEKLQRLAEGNRATHGLRSQRNSGDVSAALAPTRILRERNWFPNVVYLSFLFK